MLRRRIIPAGVLLAVSLSYSQTKPNLRERAEKGDPDAQFTLGKNYEAGRSGLKRDYAEAASWYRRAAEQGDPYAQASLGILYRFGKGVVQDNVQAYIWFYRAASQTNGGERETMEEMREAAANHLTPEQIKEAQRLARDWEPKKAQR